MGRAPKDGIDPGFFVVQQSVLGFIAISIVLAFTGLPNASPRQSFLIALCMLLSGIFNSMQLIDMSNAMQRGPNGIIWSILQCGFVIPFLVGVVFFHTPIGILRIFGIFSLLVALNLMGFLGDKGKGGIKTTGNWKWLTFRAFFWTGLCQTLTSLPSYFNFIDDIGITWRLFWSTIGFAIGSPIYTICSGRGHGLLALYRRQVTIRRSWLYSICIKTMGLLVCFFVQFPGMDIMAKCNAGAISMPLMVGSSIIGFDLYALLFLHEKRTLPQFAALLLCIAGTIAICI